MNAALVYFLDLFVRLGSAVLVLAMVCVFAAIVLGTYSLWRAHPWR